MDHPSFEVGHAEVGDHIAPPNLSEEVREVRPGDYIAPELLLVTADPGVSPVSPRYKFPHMSLERLVSSMITSPSSISPQGKSERSGLVTRAPTTRPVSSISLILKPLPLSVT